MLQKTLSQQLREVMTLPEWEIVEEVLQGLSDAQLAEDIRLYLLAYIKYPGIRIRTEDRIANFYFHACMPYVQESFRKLKNNAEEEAREELWDDDEYEEEMNEYGFY